MTDRERVVFDIERCICHVPDACRDCSKHGLDTLQCMEDLLKDALELLKEQGVSGWISVKDRLPEDDVTVLVAHTHNGKLETGTAWYLMSGSWEDSYGIFDGEEVTHWMPLPEPPKKGEQV